MSKEAEVFVQGVVHNKAGDVVVVAIPNNGISIAVGDLFTLRYDIATEDILKATPNPPRLHVKPVALRVSKIEMYGKNVAQLDHRTGSAGGLYLAGTGLDEVTAKSFLLAVVADDIDSEPA